MSTHTMATLPRISASTLSQLLLESQGSNLDAVPTMTDGKSRIAVIDVRDDDHIGGHIRTSTHIPSTTLDHQIPTLVRKLQDKEIVVFHCALSQQRGPGAAVRYLRERERLLGGESKGGSGVNAGVGKVLKRNVVDRRGVEGDGDGVGEGEGEVDNTTEEVERAEDADGEWEDIDEQGDKEGEAEEKKQQKVYVLDRGFVGWQELYGEDTRLTEGYRKEIWREGYWM